MNKNEFIREVARRCGITTYAVEEMYSASANLIVEKLIADEAVEIPKFGAFQLHAKNARNLFGQEATAEKECIYPVFKFNHAIKTRVKNGHKYMKKS